MIHSYTSSINSSSSFFSPNSYLKKRLTFLFCLLYNLVRICFHQRNFFFLFLFFISLNCFSFCFFVRVVCIDRIQFLMIAGVSIYIYIYEEIVFCIINLCTHEMLEYNGKIQIKTILIVCSVRILKGKKSKGEKKFFKVIF
jgi:hypothetical protein